MNIVIMLQKQIYTNKTGCPAKMIVFIKKNIVV